MSNYITPWTKEMIEAQTELCTLLNQLSPEQQRQVRNANYWQSDQLKGLSRIQYKIKVLKAYKEVLNKRPGI
jgi:hypothetical protein